MFGLNILDTAIGLIFVRSNRNDGCFGFIRRITLLSSRPIRSGSPER